MASNTMATWHKRTRKHKNGGRKRRRQHRATIDRHQLMRAQRREANFQNVTLAAAGVKHRAAAPLTVCVDNVVNRSINAGPRQRLDHEPALPVAVACRIPVL